MKKFIQLALLFILPAAAMAQTAAYPNGICSAGANLTVTQGLNSTNQHLGVFPGCTVTVYLTGTTTLATIFLDQQQHALTNPFTANTTTGLFVFWADGTVNYDIQLSGAGMPTTTIPDVVLHNIPQIGLTTIGSSGPSTLVDGILNVPNYAGGGGGAGNPAAPGFCVQFANSGVTSFQCDSTAGFGANSAFSYNPTTHNLGSREINGIPDAGAFQTGSGNNGIANFFATAGPNQMVVVGNDDGATDVLNVYSQTLPANSLINDIRSVSGTYGTSIYNCLDGAGPPFGTETLALPSCMGDYHFIDTVPNTGNGPYTKVVGSLSMGPGFSYGQDTVGFPWAVQGGSAVAVSKYRAGIADGFTTELDCYADGDCNGIALGMNMSGGATAGGDQSFTGFSVNGGQPDQRTMTTVAATTGTGDRHVAPAPFPGTQFYNRWTSGLVDWMIDLSVGNAGSVTGATTLEGQQGIGMTPGTYTASCTGGGGSGATLHVVVTGDGSLGFNAANLTVATGGSGYTSSPTCTLTGTGGTPPVLVPFVAVGGTITGDTAGTVPGSTYLNMMPVSATGLVVSTGDCLTASGTFKNATVTPGTYQTDTITCTVQNNHPLTSGPVWMASNVFPERDNVLTVSGGTTTGSVQTLTIQHQNPILALQNIYQGGTNGCLSLDANYAANFIFGCDFAFGAFDSTHIIYGKLSHGNILGNFIARPNNGSMFASPSAGFNGVHVFSGANILFTEFALPNDGNATLGTIGGQPTLAFNDVPFHVGDVIANPEPTTFDLTGAFAADLVSNTPADTGDSGIFLQFGGVHWTGSTRAMLLSNNDQTGKYVDFGGLLTEPQGISLQGPWATGLTMQFPPESTFPAFGISNVTSKFLFLSGGVQLFSDQPNNRWDMGGAGLFMQGPLSAGSLTVYNNPGVLVGPQLIQSVSSATSFYTSLGNTGSADGTLGLEEVDAGVIRAGTTAPTSFFASSFPVTGGTTTYNWVATSETALGGETLPSAVLTQTGGPATLTSLNFYKLSGSPQPGSQFFDVYRRTGGVGTGTRICHLTISQLQSTGCVDQGQTGTTAEPASDTSGNLIVATGATIRGLAVPVVNGPTVGQAACIKAAGPPVQIGFCSTVVSSTGACTCN